MILKKAFTFVEIIVCISIISLIWASWTFYFHDFIWKKELSIFIDDFNNQYNNLNQEVRTQTIFDYKLEIDKNAYWYIISKNNIWLETIQVADFDTQNNSVDISLYPQDNSDWELIIYEWWKKTQEKTSNWNISVEFNTEQDSSIRSTFSWSTLNTLDIVYLNNTEPLAQEVYLLDILDNNSYSHDSLIIKNISWKKSFYSDVNEANKINGPITLIFDKHWIEDKLIIN